MSYEVRDVTIKRLCVVCNRCDAAAEAESPTFPEGWNAVQLDGETRHLCPCCSATVTEPVPAPRVKR